MDTKDLSSLDFEDEQKKSWLEKFSSVIKDLFNKTRNRENKSINDVLAECAESDEEKALIRAQCEEIDNFYENRKRLEEAKAENPDLKEGDWLLREVENDLNEVIRNVEGRDLTPEEKKELRDKIEEQLDAEIENEAKCLDEELDAMNEIVSERNRKEDVHE